MTRDAARNAHRAPSESICPPCKSSHCVEGLSEPQCGCPIPGSIKRHPIYNSRLANKLKELATKREKDGDDLTIDYHFAGHSGINDLHIDDFIRVDTPTVPKSCAKSATALYSDEESIGAARRESNASEELVRRAIELALAVQERGATPWLILVEQPSGSVVGRCPGECRLRPAPDEPDERG